MTDKLASLPEALWWKYTVSDCMREGDFLAAIKEAMQAQKKRDAEICRERAVAHDYQHSTGQKNADVFAAEARACAAFIEREPIA